MSADKRTVKTDALETLGTIIDNACKRDAIHLAVEPVIAGEILTPGQDIGIENGVATSKAVKKLGIVDPFLKSLTIKEGDRFWLIVYPRQITSLRHVWTHPDFQEEFTKVAGMDELDPKAASQKWINDFADRLKQHPDRLMEAADEWVDSEEYTYDNSERYKDCWEEFEEFWVHYEVVTGRSPKEKHSFFTCSC